MSVSHFVSPGVRPIIKEGPLKVLQFPKTLRVTSLLSAALPYATALPALASLTLAGEREPGKLDLLRGTLLRAGEVLGGKLLAAGLKKGDLKFVLHGEKLRGGFALQTHGTGFRCARNLEGKIDQK